MYVLRKRSIMVGVLSIWQVQNCFVAMKSDPFLMAMSCVMGLWRPLVSVLWGINNITMLMAKFKLVICLFYLQCLVTHISVVLVNGLNITPLMNQLNIVLVNRTCCSDWFYG